jgi:two-component system, cell cycle response regulator DivK
VEIKTILVIEDNPVNMELVTAILEINDYKVLRAADAEAGIELARAHRPDLILMDVQLPGMNGLEATRLIKADEAIGEIPVVALTAYAMKKDELDAQDAGCSGYITKPFHLESFLAEIGRYLKQG